MYIVYYTKILERPFRNCLIWEFDQYIRDHFNWFRPNEDRNIHKMPLMKPFQYKEPLYFTNELDFVIILSQAIVGTLVNRKLLKDMKDDERNSSPSLIQNVMAFRTKSIMIVIPTFSLLHWSLTLNYRFPDLFYQTLCY